MCVCVCVCSFCYVFSYFLEKHSEKSQPEEKKQRCALFQAVENQLIATDKADRSLLGLK